MPSYMSSGTYTATDYPSQFLQPTAAEYHSGYSACQPMPSDGDLDPYNHSKHAPNGSLFGPWNNFYADNQTYPGHMGAPVIQPLQVDSRYTARHAGYTHRPQYDNSTFQERPPPGDKIVGGVSAQLDYEMEQMVDFVVEMAVTVVHPPSYDRVLFRKWVLQVLNATRLPSATIVLSLSYLAIRVNGMVSARTFHPTERGLYQMLTVGLILGSKFLDDNTFQNKSWAEVSNIAVGDLNVDELEWLKAFQFHLHLSPDIPDGFTCWQAKWTSFKARPVAPMLSLFPLDTSSRRARSTRQDSSPAAFPRMALEPSSAHLTPAFSPYSSWYGQRPAMNRSPSTASHSGPTTPDYYTPANRSFGQGQSTPARDNHLGHSSLPQIADLGLYQSAYDIATYGYSAPSVWSLHGSTCQCASCRHTHLLQPRYGPVMAA